MTPSLFLFLLSHFAHQFYVSKCLVEYQAAEQVFQISMHIFVEDLEEALRREGHDELWFGTDKEAPDAETYLIQYLEKHFQVKINDQKQVYSLVGKELSEDYSALWCYMEISEFPGNISKIGITNNLLMEVFEDQKNIVSLLGPKGEKDFFLFQKGKEDAHTVYD